MKRRTSEPITVSMLFHRGAQKLGLLSFLLLAFQGSLAAAPYRFLSFDESISNRKLAVKKGEEIVEIKDLHHLKRSPSINVPEDIPLTLVALDKTSPDGKQVSVDAKLPAGVTNPLVLILPDTSNPTGVRPYVIEDNAGRFRWGSIRFLNATGKPVMTKVDKKVAELPAGWTPVDVDPGGDMRNMGIQAAYKAAPTQILYSAVWEHNPDVRELVIVLPGTNARTGEMEFKIIPEDRKVVAAEAEMEKKKEEQ